MRESLLAPIPHDREAAEGVDFELSLLDEELLSRYLLTMSERIKKIRAYAFASESSLEEMRVKLDAAGPWKWIERDSHYFADYLSTRTRDDYAMLKLFENEEVQGYQLDIRFEAEGPTAEAEWQSFHEDLLSRFLPAVGAVGVRETETMN
ncbi:MAG: hypothetical protein IH986_05125 [Planctomycetes bacterium]|nr:hypothetical protein [Planctomycetota bacterium]